MIKYSRILVAAAFVLATATAAATVQTEALAPKADTSSSTTTTGPATTPTAAPVPTTPAAPVAAAPADSTVNPNYRAEPAWMPKADPTQGLVVIFRERHFVGGGVKFKIYYDDGQKFPPVKNGSFTYIYLPPGDHVLYSDKSKKRDTRLLAIEPGEVHFFEATLQMGMMKSTIDLLETDGADARQRISSLKH
jgi:hypothetical protein